MADKAKHKAAGKKTASDRIEVRQSGVHGKGVYAIAPIAEGERVIEYKGEHISWKKALERHPHDPSDPNHTFYFSLDDGSVIDAKFGGKIAAADFFDERWRIKMSEERAALNSN